MTIASLTGPRLRIERVESQVGALETEIRDWLEIVDYPFVVAEYLDDIERYALRVSDDCVHRLPDPMWGIAVGEIAHNLRSALDGLAWQLGLWNRKRQRELLTPFPKLSFPIMTSTGTLRTVAANDARVHSVLKDRLHPDHAKRVLNLQPYRRGNGGARNVLALLEELNNSDKHRLLQVVTVRGIAVGYAFPAGVSTLDAYRFDLKRPLGPGVKVGSIRRDLGYGSHPDHFGPMYDVAFWEGCKAVKRRSVAPLLNQMATAVGAVIELFARDF